MAAFNTPSLRDENNTNQMKRYVHQPLNFDHYGIHGKILENGHVRIAWVDPVEKKADPDYEYDEVEVPASLIFKLATLLKVTRQVVYVPVGEVAKTE